MANGNALHGPILEYLHEIPRHGLQKLLVWVLNDPNGLLLTQVIKEPISPIATMFERIESGDCIEEQEWKKAIESLEDTIRAYGHIDMVMDLVNSTLDSPKAMRAWAKKTRWGG